MFGILTALFKDKVIPGNKQPDGVGKLVMQLLGPVPWQKS